MKRIASVLNPNKIVCALLLVFISSYFGVFAGTKGLFVLSIFIGVILLAFHFFGLVKSYRMAFSFLWIALFVYLLISSLFNFSQAVNYIVLFAVGGLVLFIRFDKSDFIFVFKIISLISIVLAASIIWQAYLPDSFYSFAKYWFYHSTQYENVFYQGVLSGQMSGIFCEVSYSAFFLSLGCGYAASNLFFKKRIVLNAFLLSLFYFAILLTGKRSFLLIVPGVLIVAFLLSCFKNLTRGKLITVFVLATVLIFATPLILDSTLSILTDGTGTIQLSSREIIWNLAIQSFVKKPLFGVGINSFDLVFNSSGIRSSYYSFAGAHNAYLQILCETGIIGFLLYFCFIGAAIISIIKTLFQCENRNDKEGAMLQTSSLICLLFSMAYGLTGNPLHQPQQLMTIFILISISLGVSALNKNRRTMVA